ncbi:MAG TPA: phosphotransferase [Acetobacteraceae bacterium]|nr:phosphotransferase [Acetobacteraceae bacterium]
MPHAGSMVLLDRVERWDSASVLCRTRSHLDPANPLRHAGRLAALCGIEYGLQAAALHGGLQAGAAQQAGYAASLRGVILHVDRLDDPALGELRVEATLETQERFGIVYAFEVRSDAGAPLVAGRASIALPR